MQSLPNSGSQNAIGRGESLEVQNSIRASVAVELVLVS